MVAEIGLGLVAFGLAFLALGVMFFFDKGLLAMGNVSRGKWVGGAGAGTGCLVQYLLGNNTHTLPTDVLSV